MSGIEQAFQDHRQAQLIREAIAYVKVWTRVGDDEELQWADGEVMDAAEKYAAYLEQRAYRGSASEEPTR
jgi:hypothetical protein